MARAQTPESWRATMIDELRADENRTANPAMIVKLGG